MWKVYKLSFRNGREYVGITCRSIEERLKRHKRLSDAANRELYDLLQQEKPKITIIHPAIHSQHLAYQYEAMEIKFLKSPINLTHVPKWSIEYKDLEPTPQTQRPRNYKYRDRKERKIDTPREGEYKCSKCGQVKDWTEFYKDRCRFNGLNSRCKVCFKQQQWDKKIAAA